MIEFVKNTTTRSIQSRSFLFTKFIKVNSDEEISYNCEDLCRLFERLDYVRGSVFQPEKCPSTGRIHLQGYVEFNKKITTKKFKEDLNDNGIHLERRRGSKKQAIDYCTKEESRLLKPYFTGKIINQGKRSDLDELINFMSDEPSLKDIAQEYPKQMILHHRGIKEYAELMRTEVFWRDLTTTVFWGDTGVGKTRRVYEDCKEDLYKLDYSNSLWWDGYNGQKNLLIDDFYGWIKYGHLLNILDGYPLRLEIKGSFTIAKYTKVFITSNVPPEEWYPSKGLTPALNRRLTKIIHMKDNIFKK